MFEKKVCVSVTSVESSTIRESAQTGILLNILSGSSGQVPNTSLGGNRAYCTYGNSMHFWGCKELIPKNGISCSTPWCQTLWSWGTLLRATIHLASAINACYSHRAKYIWFPPMCKSGSWPVLPERALNIICISLIFLEGLEHNYRYMYHTVQRVWSMCVIVIAIVTGIKMVRSIVALLISEMNRLNEDTVEYKRVQVHRCS